MNKRTVILKLRIYFLLIFIGLPILLIAYKVYNTKSYIWLPYYFSQELERILGKEEKPDHSQPIDIMFVFVDHFEPNFDEELNSWVNNYPESIEKHFDFDGKHPQHTWFYARENTEWLKKLSALSYDGYGEVEFHLHHGNDTSESLREKIEYYKNLYSQAGCLITAEEKPRQTYGFIHGMWSLDNSRGNKYCGVNNELTILKDTGCYADFTLPSYHETQSSIVNRIFYAVDNPNKPKSYNSGNIAKVNSLTKGDLMIFEGPLTIISASLPKFETSEIETFNYPNEKRVDAWIKANVHVIGQPNWIFVKVDTHAAKKATADIVLGKPMQEVYSYLETKYNDGKKYRLHYVTTREAYNIVKAAEEGNKRGNPDSYRDYIIKPYANIVIKSDSLYKLKSYSPGVTFSLDILENKNSEIILKNFLLQKMYGRLESIGYKQNCDNGMIDIYLTAKDEIEFVLKLPNNISSIKGAEIIKELREGPSYIYVLKAMLGKARGTIKIKFKNV